MYVCMYAFLEQFHQGLTVKLALTAPNMAASAILDDVRNPYSSPPQYEFP